MESFFSLWAEIPSRGRLDVERFSRLWDWRTSTLCVYLLIFLFLSHLIVYHLLLCVRNTDININIMKHPNHIAPRHRHFLTEWWRGQPGTIWDRDFLLSTVIVTEAKLTLTNKVPWAKLPKALPTNMQSNVMSAKISRWTRAARNAKKYIFLFSLKQENLGSTISLRRFYWQSGAELSQAYSPTLSCDWIKS